MKAQVKLISLSLVSAVLAVCGAFLGKYLMVIGHWAVEPVNVTTSLFAVISIFLAWLAIEAG
jgi:hypothetical protein